MRVALAKHDLALKDAIESNGGTVFKTMGDAFLAWFESATGAARAAIKIQAFAPTFSDDVDLKIRVAVHTGEAEARDNDFFGPTLNRTARLLGIAHGGQVVFSSAAHSLAIDEGSWIDCGEHRLKDLGRPEHVFQLTHPSFNAVVRPLASLSHLKHNLPVQLTRFIGREAQMAELSAGVSANRLVTVVGAAGSGKTRLVLQTAAELVDDFPDGVWFVELANVDDERSVLSAVLSALELSDTEAEQQQGTLTRNLAAKSALLLLDNCEHVVEAAAKVTRLVLGSCPNVSMVATSREPLGVGGEAVFRISELARPKGSGHGLAGVVDSEAVQLFLDRVRHANPRFELTAENVDSVCQICDNLDGNPLAIELAAARISVMTPKEVASRLDDALRLLTTGSRTASPRHQTLRGAIEWSYRLLSSKEQLALQRLSVFAGSWDLAAATAVLADSDLVGQHEVVDLLASLVDKSLLSISTEQDSTRYSMARTIRRFVGSELSDEAGTRLRHFRYFAAKAREASLAADDETNRRLFHESAEIRNALDWAVDQSELLDETLGMMNDLHVSCLVRWNPAVVYDYWRRLVQPLTVMEGDKTRLTSLSHAVYYASHAENTSVAREWASIGLRMAEGMEPDPDVGRLYNAIGSLELADGNHDAAEQHYMRALAAVKAANHIPGIVSVTTNLAETARSRSDFKRATEYYEDMLQLCQRYRRNADQARCLIGIAEVSLGQLDTESALTVASRIESLFNEDDEPQAIARTRSYIVANSYHVNGDPRTHQYLRDALAFTTRIEDATGQVECLSRLIEHAALDSDVHTVVSLMRELCPLARRNNRMTWIRACYWAALAFGQTELSTQVLGTRKAARAKLSSLRSPYEDWNLAEMERLVGLGEDRPVIDEPSIWQLVDSLRTMR